MKADPAVPPCCTVRTTGPYVSFRMLTVWIRTVSSLGETIALSDDKIEMEMSLSTGRSHNSMNRARDNCNFSFLRFMFMF